MRKSVIIDCFPDHLDQYRTGYAIVAVDVIRATTSAVTAAASGRRCFPVPTMEAALALARKFDYPLLAGELGGNMPAGFHLNNSPAELFIRTDIHRPVILLSSSGTRLMHLAGECEAAYPACFRNHSAVARYLAGRHARVAIIGAGTRGQFREEDQICCAWIAAELMRHGYEPEGPDTGAVLDRWRSAPASACLCSRSVDYLKRTGQRRDLDFILGSVDDLRAVFALRGGEVTPVPAEDARAARNLELQPAIALSAS